jgi:hypothetical protein
MPKTKKPARLTVKGLGEARASQCSERSGMVVWVFVYGMQCGAAGHMRCDAMPGWKKEMCCDYLLACHMVDGAGSCCGGGLLLDQTRDGLGMTRRRLEGRFDR